MQAILRAKGVGKALVPFYPQLLSMFNLFRSWRQNLGDGIDYKQVRNEDLGDLVRDTLEMMERTGGKGAGMKIKAMVPTYQHMSRVSRKTKQGHHLQVRTSCRRQHHTKSATQASSCSDKRATVSLVPPTPVDS